MRRQKFLTLIALSLGLSTANLGGSPLLAQTAANRPAIADVVVDAEPETADATMPSDEDDQYVSYLEAAAPADAKAAADLKKKKADLKKAVASAYAPVFYNNKFDYLCNPLYEGCLFGEALKRNPLGDCWVYDIGGQYRARYHGERGIRGLGLTGRNDDFLLHRVRLFGNLERGDDFRFFAEMVDAESNYENFAPRGIEVNRTDMLNLFGDFKLADNGCGKLKLRVGRQELLYGSERLISPLDWANTRRTFEGAKAYWVGEDWNIDAFFTRPVIVNPVAFDSPHYQQEFMGLWATYKAIKNQTLDLYALQYNNGVVPAGRPQGFEFTTLGSRWQGSDGSFLWDVEGGVQFGDNVTGTNHSAGFFTAGVGKKYEERCWKPTIWAFYDWASGGDVRGAGNGFNHQFPLAHKYLGFMDIFARSNIQSPNILVQAQPHEKFKTTFWYYYFLLDTTTDTPYNVNMSAFRPANAPTSRDLGHEIDLIGTYSINPRMDLLLGYSHFFAGSYYKGLPAGAFRGNADFFYVQYQWNF